MSQEQFISQITAWLHGQLSPALSEEMEEALLLHPEWQNAMDVIALERLAHERLMEEDLRSRMQLWEDGYEDDVDDNEAIDQETGELEQLAHEHLLEQSLLSEMKNWENKLERKATRKKWWLVSGVALAVLSLSGIFWIFRDQFGESHLPPALETVPILLPPSESSAPIATEEQPGEPTETRKKLGFSSPKQKNSLSGFVALADEIMDNEQAVNDIFSTVRKGTNNNINQDSLLKKAWETGDSVRFETAVRIADMNKTRLLKLSGHFYYGIRDFSKAAANFRLLADDIQWGQDADWYVALSYLAQYPRHVDDFQKAICHILDTPGHYHQQHWKKLEARFIKLRGTPFDCSK